MIRSRLWATSLFMFLCINIYGQSSISDPANPKDITIWHGKTIIFFSPHEDDDACRNLFRFDSNFLLVKIESRTKNPNYRQ